MGSCGLNALLPCPFCGGDAAINSCRTSEREFIRLNGRDTGYGVNCISCGVNTRSVGVGYATQEEAATAWNRRTRCIESEYAESLSKIARPMPPQPMTKDQEAEQANIRG